VRLPVVDLDGRPAGELELSDAVFAAPVRRDLLQRAVVWQLAKRRSGTRKTRSRAELAYSRAKMFRQKGTGRARRGDRRANILRGGGTAHGPVVRSHETSLPRRLRRQALRAALSAKAASGDLHLLDAARADEIRTRPAARRLEARGWTDALLIDGPAESCDRNFVLSVRNLPTVHLLPAEGANVHDVLRRRSLVITRAGVAALEARLS